MCNRYAQYLAPEAVRRFFRIVGVIVPNHPASWNVAPTQRSMVVRLDPNSGDRQLEVMRWGLVPDWARDVSIGRKAYNAWSDTAADKAMFRNAMKRGWRCIIPADAFYEWKVTPSGKQPYAIARADGAPLALAGLWEHWRDADGALLHSFTILTTEPNDLMGKLHDGMPVILGEQDFPLWLGETEGDAAALMRPCPDAWLKAWRVSSRVGNVGNNDASLIEQAP